MPITPSPSGSPPPVSDKYLTVRFNDIHVFHSAELHGGGTTHGQQFIPVIRELFGKVSRVFETCAGPGYIGFSVLSEKLCDSLCLSDINPLAIEAIKHTIDANSLEDRVSYFLSDGMKDVPDSERFDLVILNPPHFSGGVTRGIIANDTDWLMHERFYSDIAGYLTPDGSILVIENYHGSSEQDFVSMIENAGLTIIRSIMYCHTMPAIANPYYFLWVRKQGSLLSNNCFDPGQKMPVTLTSCDAVTIQENCKCYFELFDDQDRDVGLKNSHGITFFRLKPFVSIRENSGLSCSSLFTAGEFELYDLATLETLLKINVIPASGSNVASRSVTATI